MSKVLYHILTEVSPRFGQLVQIEEFLQLAEDPSSPKYYNIFSIPKPNGKQRMIEEPAAGLKYTQQAILKVLNKVVPLHPAVHGLGERAVLQNARAHQGRRIVVKMDVYKFFPWTDINKFRHGFIQLLQHLEPADRIKAGDFVMQAEKFCFIDDHTKLRLPTGAPTSPYVSAIAFTGADYLLADYAQKNNLVYTRYIDDMTFSGDSYPSGLQREVRQIVEASGYLVNREKTERLYSDNHPQVITGVQINGNGIPKQYRRNLRAELDHHARLHTELDDVLKGKLAFIAQVNGDLADKFHHYFDERVAIWENLRRY